MEQPLYQSSGDTPIVTPDPPASPPPPVQGQVPPPPPVVSPLPPSSSIATPTSPPSRGGFSLGKVFTVLGILLAIVLILALAYSLFGKNSPVLKSEATLTYWGLWESDSTMQNLIAEFESQNPKIKVNYVQQNHTEYRERLQTALKNDRGPDIYRIHNTWVPMFRDFLQPLPVDVYSPADFSATFYPVANKDARLGANLVAIPLGMDNLVMYVNDSLLSETGLTVPKTWDELKIAAVAIAKCSTANNKCTPGARVLTAGAALGSTFNIDHWQEIVALLMLQNNVSLDNPGGASTQASQDVINYFNSFVQEIHVWDPNLTTSTNLFASGKAGIIFAPSWRALEILSINPNLKFSTHPVPQPPLDPAKNEQPIAYATYWMEAVNNKSKHSSQAWAFLKFLSQAENQQKLFASAVQQKRAFGEPYSRIDLSGQAINQPYVGSVISQLPYSNSWYLASFTHDGVSGINTRLSDFFAKLINGQESLPNSGAAIGQILAEYGLAGSQ